MIHQLGGRKQAKARTHGGSFARSPSMYEEDFDDKNNSQGTIDRDRSLSCGSINSLDTLPEASHAMKRERSLSLLSATSYGSTPKLKRSKNSVEFELIDEKRIKAMSLCRQDSDSSMDSQHSLDGGGNLGTSSKDFSKEKSRDSSFAHNIWRRFMIHPRASWKIKWDLFIGIFIVYSVVVVPYEMAFDVQKEWPETPYLLDRAVDALFLLDMFIQFRTGFLNPEDTVVMNPGKAAAHYIKTWFIIDFCSSVPFDVIIEPMLVQPNSDDMNAPSANTIRSLKIIRIVRLVRLTKIVRLLKLKKFSTIMEEQTIISPQTLRMINMLLRVLFCIHFLSCMWRWLGTPSAEVHCDPNTDDPCYVIETMEALERAANSQNGPDSGLRRSLTTTSGEGSEGSSGGQDLDPFGDMRNAPLVESLGHREMTWVIYFKVYKIDNFDQYIASIHMVTASMMAVGYGDIFATNTGERLLCILVQLVGAAFFGLTLSAITQLIDSVDAQAIEKRRRFSEYEEWMEARELSDHWRKRIRKHLKYDLEARSVHDEPALLFPLALGLRNEVTKKYRASRVESVRACFPPSAFPRDIEHVIYDLIPYLRPHQILRGDILYEQDEPCDDTIFVATGSIEGVQRNEAHRESNFRFLENLRRRKKLDVKPHAPEGSGGDPQETQHFVSGTLCVIFGADQIFPGSIFRRNLSLLTWVCSRDAELLVLSRDEFFQSCARLADSRFLEELDSIHMKKYELIKDIIETNEAEYSGGTGEGPHLGNHLCSIRPAKSSIVFNWKKYPLEDLPNHDVVLASFTIGAVKSSTDKNGVGELKRTRRRTMSGIVEESFESSSDMLARGIIPPHLIQKIYWDIFVGCLIMFSIIIIPIRIGLHIEVKGVEVHIDTIVDLTFGVDMLLSMRTAYTDRTGILETNPKNVLKNYLKTWFIVDFFSTIPIDKIVEAIIGTSGEVRVVKLVRTIRLFRLLKLARILKMGKSFGGLTSVAADKMPPWLVHLSKLVFYLFIMAHILGCFWFYVAFQDEVERHKECDQGHLKCSLTTPSTAWWEGQEIHPLAFGDQYAAALYWAFSTMTTVGYGDITPNTTQSRVYAICAQIFGATVFGYVIGSVAAAAGIEHGQEQVIKARLRQVREFIDEQNLSANLIKPMCKQTRAYLLHKTPFEEERFMESLPHHIRTQATLNMFDDIICLYPLFASQYNWIICTIVRLMEPQAISQGEYIHLGKDLYFSYKGHFQADEKDLGLVFSPGTIFGVFEEFINVFKPMLRVQACPKLLPTDVPYCMYFVIRNYRLTNMFEPQITKEIKSIFFNAMVLQYRNDIPRRSARLRRAKLNSLNVPYEKETAPGELTSMPPGVGPDRSLDETASLAAEQEFKYDTPSKTLKLNIPLPRNLSYTEFSKLQRQIRSLLDGVSGDLTNPYKPEHEQAIPSPATERSSSFPSPNANQDSRNSSFILDKPPEKNRDDEIDAKYNVMNVVREDDEHSLSVSPRDDTSNRLSPRGTSFAAEGDDITPPALSRDHSPEITEADCVNGETGQTYSPSVSPRSPIHSSDRGRLFTFAPEVETKVEVTTPSQFTSSQ